MKVPEPKKLPSGNYNIRMRLGGEDISITRLTAKECKQEAALIKAEHKAGKRMATKSKNTESSIGEIIDAYIKSREKVLSPSTISGYRVVRKNRFCNYIDKKPSQIKNWQAVINAEVVDNISPKTIKNSWALLCSAFEYAGIAPPPVKLPKVMSAQRPWLDADQVQVFIKAIKGKTCEIPALLALHSLRRSEILALTWDKIDLERNLIRVESSAVPDSNNNLVFKQTTKSKKSRRTVPIMIPQLKEALLSVPEESRTGRIYTHYQNKLWEQINQVCAENGLPLVGVHGLRHSFASIALHVGLPEQETMLIGGWEDAQTMHRIYEHISNADRIKSENKLAEFFKSQNKNADENADEVQKAQ